MFKENKVMKYNMTICNIRKMDNVYIKRIIPANRKEKGNDYTIKYNAKMNNNMEMETINIKRKGKNCIYYERK